MKEKFSLKDHLFNEEKVKGLAGDIYAIYPDFNQDEFVSKVVNQFPLLELKQRITWISTCLKDFLPEDYRKAINIILQALPKALDNSLKDNDFGDFIYSPYSEFVATYGCTRENLYFSLEAIKEITKRFSAEYAIRKFINAFSHETLKIIYEWSKDDNYHVRRLASEGTRQKLPWGEKITIDPVATLSILDNLYYDPTRFVTRSVANHLNDLSKSHPELLLATLERWKGSGKQADAEMQFIIKHTLRNLVKNGNPKAMSMLGFSDASGIEIINLQSPKEVKIGEILTFSFEISSTFDKRVVIDYIVHFQNKQGQMKSKKVHKLQSLDLAAKRTIFISKNHPFRANMTTRKLYPGAHKVELQINGEVLNWFEFDLVM